MLGPAQLNTVACHPSPKRASKRDQIEISNASFWARDVANKIKGPIPHRAYSVADLENAHWVCIGTMNTVEELKDSNIAIKILDNILGVHVIAFSQ